jgi:uncharacterized protein RhaS with RHS repeats
MAAANSDRPGRVFEICKTGKNQNKKGDKMKKLFFIILFLNLFVAVQAQTKDYNSTFPQFTPYQNASGNDTDAKILGNIKDLGKEQPARWISVDPLANKYPGWSPYNYTKCNPLVNIDPHGDSLVALSDPSAAFGFGHMAQLIGSESGGWEYFSKNGAAGPIPGFGPSKSPNIGAQTGDVYPTLAAFAEQQKDYNYKSGFLVESNSSTDQIMKSTAATEVKSPQLAYGNNCADAVTNTMEKGGFNGGLMQLQNKNPNDPLAGTQSTIYDPFPNHRYQSITINNTGIDVSKLIQAIR